MSYHYAQIDSGGICFAISELSGEVNVDDMIRVKSYDVSLLGKQYVDGEWIDVEAKVEDEA